MLLHCSFWTEVGYWKKQNQQVLSSPDSDEHMPALKFQEHQNSSTFWDLICMLVKNFELVKLPIYLHNIIILGSPH